MRAPETRLRIFGTPSVRGPFGHRQFSVLWTATVLSATGGWMYTAAAAWLMTELDASPLQVSLVQVAAGLPMFLFALPAGALADIVDKRRLLLFAESLITVFSILIAVLVWTGSATPFTLLACTFSIEAGFALSAPAWQSIVPQLIPRPLLPAAIAANSVGTNLSRAVGPALGGVLTAVIGVAAPFWFNAASNLASIGALLWWRAPLKASGGLPVERFASAIRNGVRYARNNPPLRATLVRAVSFFFFASAYWALLPLIARTQIGGGPELYGLLLGTVGAGAITCSLMLGRLKDKLGPDRIVASSTAATALALVLFGLADEPWTAVIASLIAGAAWIAAVSNLNVSAQFALPEWVRGRGLAIYVTVMFGGLSAGSALWGRMAELIGLPWTHYIAAGGALLLIPITRRWKVQAAAGIDLAPSMHWQPPVVSGEIEPDEGPVLVTIEYRIRQDDREAFTAALRRLALQRRRDGAYAWGLFEDTADPGRFLENFLVESWLEHLRQHERVTNADHLMEQEVIALLVAPPKIAHLVATR